MLEESVEDYARRRVAEEGGEMRKLKWIGRRKAPDDVVMLRVGSRVGRYATISTIWAEFKKPGGLKTFPKNAHERAQDREHKRMREAGQTVVVVDSYEGVEELLR
jgi:hypothetical protein